MDAELSEYARWEYAALFRDFQDASTPDERAAIQAALKDMDGRMAALKEQNGR